MLQNLGFSPRAQIKSQNKLHSKKMSHTERSSSGGKRMKCKARGGPDSQAEKRPKTALEISTEEELLRIYPGFATERVTWNLFGRASQVELDRMKEVWFPEVGDYYFRLAVQDVWDRHPSRRRDSSAPTEATLLDLLKRYKPDDSSRLGSRTAAMIVNDMINDGKLIEDPNFDAQLSSIMPSGDFWVESEDSPPPKFPPAHASEKTVVRPLFAKTMKKFATLCAGNRRVYRAGPDGKYNVPATLNQDVICVPDAFVYDAPTVGSRKPDMNVYYESCDVKGVLRIVSSWELTPRDRENNHEFRPEEIGQLIDTNKELLRQQPFRTFTLAVLSDGVRFVFFKVSRSTPHGNDYTVRKSSTFLNMRGWAVAFALLLQPPSFFRYKSFVMDGLRFNREIGQGAHTYVFEVSIEGKTDPRVLKLFERPAEYEVELKNLRKLRNILQNRHEFSHAPHIERELVVTEAESGKVFRAIMSLPLCMPIGPQRW